MDGCGRDNRPKQPAGQGCPNRRGGSRGVGAQRAWAFAEEGAHAAIAGRKAQSCIDLAAEIERKTGVDALGLAGHVGDGDSLPVMVDAMYARFGPAGGVSIINIGSDASERPVPESVPYGVARAEQCGDKGSRGCVRSRGSGQPHHGRCILHRYRQGAGIVRRAMIWRRAGRFREVVILARLWERLVLCRRIGEPYDRDDSACRRWTYGRGLIEASFGICWGTG